MTLASRSRRPLGKYWPSKDEDPEPATSGYTVTFVLLGGPVAVVGALWLLRLLDIASALSAAATNKDSPGQPH